MMRKLFHPTSDWLAKNSPIGYRSILLPPAWLIWLVKLIKKNRTDWSIQLAKTWLLKLTDWLLNWFLGSLTNYCKFLLRIPSKSSHNGLQIIAFVIFQPFFDEGVVVGKASYSLQQGIDDCKSRVAVYQDFWGAIVSQLRDDIGGSAPAQRASNILSKRSVEPKSWIGLDHFTSCSRREKLKEARI